ncbi:hypothetical protein QBC42DRAFT_262767, partial [Cladorrhinum samala]
IPVPSKNEGKKRARNQKTSCFEHRHLSSGGPAGAAIDFSFFFFSLLPLFPNIASLADLYIYPSTKLSSLYLSMSVTMSFAATTPLRRSLSRSVKRMIQRTLPLVHSRRRSWTTNAKIRMPIDM